MTLSHRTGAGRTHRADQNSGDLHLAWVLRWMPETRGIALEEMQAHLRAPAAAKVAYAHAGELEGLVNIK